MSIRHYPAFALCFVTLWLLLRLRREWTPILIFGLSHGFDEARKIYGEER